MKLKSYFICLALIVIGVFCGIQLYKEIKAENYINGSIDITNQFSQESFNYSSTSLTFYNDIYDETETYLFEKDLLQVDDFNGVDKNYILNLNDYILTDTVFSQGSVFSVVTMEFYDTDGNVVCNPEMKISIKFLSNKTKLTITTIGQLNASFLHQYFSDNGIRLKIVEIF